MACSYNVVFLLDTAVSVEKTHLHLCALKILNCLGCKFGLAKVRWGFKFFDSLGIQGRTSRVGTFRELGSRAWEDFEEELENRFGNRGSVPHLPGPTPRVTLTQNILKETLLDYQWDRPEIASPAKPLLRSRKSKKTQTVENPPENTTSGHFVNAIFLFSPCPHSQRELLQFVSGSQAHMSDELPPLRVMAEKFMPRGMQDIMATQKIALYWLDTSERFKLLESPDHIGYWMLVELVRLFGGTILPFATLSQSLYHQRVGMDAAFPEASGPSQLPLGPWSTIVPFESTLQCLFSLPSALQASFPSLEGALFFKTEGVEETRSYAVTLEPLIMGQHRFQSPVNIFLKCTMADWNAAYTGHFRTESWVVQAKETGQSVQDISLFQQFLKCILAQKLHMVAEVNASESLSPCTGIFSPISETSAVLSLLYAEPDAEAERFSLQTAVKERISKDSDFSLAEMANHVLNQVSSGSDGSCLYCPPDALIPEWASQELTHTPHWSPAVIESWYSSSNFCGASFQLMESFGLLQAGSARKKESPELETNLTHCLSEFYQKKSSDHTSGSHQQTHRKRHGVPRTPVRQKMKTMPRSLQMLNAARLNVKAQKLQPAGELVTSEKVSQRSLARRLDGTIKERRNIKSKMCFRTEEEMLSYVTEHYQSALTTGENMLFFAQDMVSAVYMFQKSNQESTVETIRSSLLRTSQVLRQQLGSDADKDVKIKECRLQVYLQLEMCVQCPFLQTNASGMEKLAEEVTELLRILCLAKDPGYLSRFLEDVVDTYVESLPKMLGDLYYSLGTQIPPKLASVLPADLFSDDSISQEGQTPSLPASLALGPASRPASFASDADELEELRCRSAKKRRNMLAKHRSMTEAPQKLRQIEVPQVPKNRSRKGSSHSCLDMKSEPAEKKAAVQVTKVRRNLFDEKMLSPGKRSLAMVSRSQSVSALEGLKHKRSQANEGARGGHKLLTKSVAETPLHKQISRRLLHKQIKGRCSDPGTEVCIVEESPEKSITCGLRRSPRIKWLLLDRTQPGSFYNAESSKRSMERGYSVQRKPPGDQENLIGLTSPPVKKAFQSPKSLLFGAVLDEFSSEGTDSTRTSKKPPSDQPAVYATPRKSPFQTSQRTISPASITLRRSPRIPQKAQSERILPKSPVRKNTAAKSLAALFSPRGQKSKSLPEFVGNEEVEFLPGEEFSSPCKMSLWQTFGKPERQGAADDVFASPSSVSDSAALLPVTPPPMLRKAGGKPSSEIWSPRRSLRVAWKFSSPTSAQKQITAAERVTMGPEQRFPWDLDPVSDVATPTGFPAVLSKQSSCPKRANFSPPVESIPLLGSSLCDQVLSTGATSLLSPTRSKGLARNSSVPREPPSRLQNVINTSPVKPPQSSSCVIGEELDFSGHDEESQGRGSTSLSAKTSPFCKSMESRSTAERVERTTPALTSDEGWDSEGGKTPESSRRIHGVLLDAIVLCEPLDRSSLFGKAITRNPQVIPGQEASPDAVSPTEKVVGFADTLFRSPPQASRNTPKSSSSSYALRCTPDRRQREAAARLGHAEKGAAGSGTPLVPRALHSGADLPTTYEVELEMQASGLPKLRIKRIASGSVPEAPSCTEPGKSKMEENGLAQGELSVTWCGKHPEKPAEPASASPSCLHSAHSTPGKFGGAGQTYICQSYTPTRCTSCTMSPSQGGGIPWTPSPKHKGKVTPEAIKDWPRRKRPGVGGVRSERPAGATGEMKPCEVNGTRAPEPFLSSKALLPGEFELEGICRLQDQSPCSDAEPAGEENGRETPCLNLRKRAFESTSPEKTVLQEMKRSCQKTESPGAYTNELLSTGKGALSSNRTIQEGEEVFSFSGLTPPSSSGKSSLSASGLLALTESPLLYQGHLASLKKHPTGDDSEVFGGAKEDLSPFHGAVTRRRSLTRTYSRKKLLT